MKQTLSDIPKLKRKKVLHYVRNTVDDRADQGFQVLSWGSTGKDITRQIGKQAFLRARNLKPRSFYHSS
jgi:hypothetical protein